MEAGQRDMESIQGHLEHCAYAARMVVTCFHIQGRDLFLEANRRGDCWVETEEEEDYSLTLKSGKAHRSPGPASLCLPAAITPTCGQPLGAVHEVWAPLLHFLLIEAAVCCFLPG